jgi:hypothetical protein
VSARSSSTPAAALWLGLAGLIPFFGLALADLTGIGLQPEPAGRLLMVYGAVILSFLGGVQWGLAAADDGPLVGAAAWRRYGLSVAPSLVAWAAVGVWPQAALGVLSIAHAALVLHDVATARAGEAPVWYGRLRIVLGTGAAVSLGVCALAAGPP